MLPLKHSPGRLADNVMHFARVLREAGMPLGTDRTLLALQALQVAGMASRQDLHSVLSCCLLDGARHRELFDQAFDLFWRDPDLSGRMRALLLPKVQLKDAAQPPTHPPNASAHAKRISAWGRTLHPTPPGSPARTGPTHGTTICAQNRGPQARFSRKVLVSHTHPPT